MLDIPSLCGIQAQRFIKNELGRKFFYVFTCLWGVSLQWRTFTPPYWAAAGNKAVQSTKALWRIR